MEFFQENTFLYNVAAVAVVLVLFLLILKFVESLAKTLLIFIGVLIVGYGLIRFFPNVAEPVTRFVGFGSSNKEESDVKASPTDYERSTYLDSNTRYKNENYNYDGGINNNGGAYDGNSAYNINPGYENNTTYDGSGTQNGSYYNENNAYNGATPYDEEDTYDDVDRYY